MFWLEARIGSKRASLADMSSRTKRLRRRPATHTLPQPPEYGAVLPRHNTRDRGYLPPRPLGRSLSQRVTWKGSSATGKDRPPGMQWAQFMSFSVKD